MLGRGDDVRLQAESLRAPPIAGPAEAANHFVGHQQDIVFLEDRGDLGPIGLGRNDDAAGTLHRFGKQCRDRIRAFRQDQLFKILRAARGKCLFALAGFAEAVVMRAVGAQDAGDRQIEIVVERRQAGERGGRHGDAVIGLHAGNDLFLLRTAQRVVEIPDHLDRGIVGFRAGIAEIGLRHRHRCQLHQLLGQFHCRGRHLLGKGVVEWQRLHLLLRCLDQARLRPKTQRAAPQAGQAVEILLAVLGIDEGAIAAHDHKAAILFILQGVGVAVEVKSAVARGE